MKKSTLKLIGGALIALTGMSVSGALGAKFMGEGLGEKIIEAESKVYTETESEATEEENAEDSEETEE